MLDKKDLDKLKSLKPREEIYDQIGAFLEWEKSVLPLLSFSSPLYNKFQEQAKHVVNATMAVRTDDLKLHVKIMVGLYNESIPQLEKLIKKQRFKENHPAIHFLLMEWRPLLQVPVAFFVVLATFFITRHFTASTPPQDKPAQQKTEKSYSNASSQTGKTDINHVNKPPIIQIKDTPEKIIAEINSVPPLQREDVAKTFVGIPVDWELYFASGSPDAKNYNLFFRSSLKLDSVIIHCSIPKENNDRLRRLQEKTKLRVQGKIERAGYNSITLKDSKIIQQ